jgi:hypothetical protein
MGRYRCSRELLPWLAANPHSDGHECAKGAATLHHGFPNAAHQLPTPHSDPEEETKMGPFGNKITGKSINVLFPIYVCNVIMISTLLESDNPSHLPFVDIISSYLG